MGATALGAVVGGIAMRKYDVYFPPEPKKNDGPELEGNPPQPMLSSGFGGAPSPFMPVFSFGGAPQPTAPQPNAPRKRRKSIGELTQELRQRKQEERSSRYAAAEEAFYDED
jgi:hypothetical protein